MYKRQGEHLAADAFVMAAGSFSVQLLRSVGIPLPVYPANCLLYTSDAADERSSVDLGGRRIIKKKKR